MNPDGETIKNDPLYRRACHDASWHLLTEIILHHAENSGRQVVMVPPYWSSQTCPKCQRWVKKTLADRVHRCPHCGFTVDRDVAAAMVLRQRGLKLLDGEYLNLYPKGHPKNP